MRLKHGDMMRTNRSGEGRLRRVTTGAALVAVLGFIGAVDAGEMVSLGIEPLMAIEGTAEHDWTQARTAYVPGGKPMWITTMSQTRKRGTHAFHDIFESISRDGGRTWTPPRVIPSLRRTRSEDGYEVAPGDLYPMWHETTGCVFVNGKTFNFAEGVKEDILREKVSYAVRNPDSGEWGQMRTVIMPDRDHSGGRIIAANAGCHQRVHLANGDVLLPVRYQRSAGKRQYVSVVARCEFDGEKLTYKEHGTEHTVARGRGLYEPSIASFGGRFFLTLRADHSAFVTRGEDGIRFEPQREWTFDDGQPLGSYNAQQHWVVCGGGLFLVYTRRGADNDHIMRHRAPLFIGQVDPERLCVIRASERVLLPENHATLGNSGICRVSENESWVTCGEGRVSHGRRKGGNNRVLITRIGAAGAR